MNFWLKGLLWIFAAGSSGAAIGSYYVMNTSTSQKSSQEVVEQGKDEEISSQPREEERDCLEIEIDCEGEEYYDRCFSEDLM